MLSKQVCLNKDPSEGRDENLIAGCLLQIVCWLFAGDLQVLGYLLFTKVIIVQSIYYNYPSWLSQ